MNKSAGMIGLGIMGMPMSANMLKDGIVVYGYGGPRSNAEKIASLEKLGGKGTRSPREVAEKTDIVLTCLPSVASLNDVISGKDGILSAGRKDIIVVETSTFPIEDKQKARNILQQAGIVMLDCPLSGTGAQAVRKDLAVFASGDKEVYEKCIPIFKGFSRVIYYLGEFGNGSKMKYVANLLVAIHNVSAAEAFVLGMKAGLDPQMIYDVVGDGAGSSRMFQVRGPLMVRGQYEPATMKVEIWQKDMKIIADFAARLDCPTPLLAASAAYYTAAMAQGRGGEDTAAVCAVLEQMARLQRGASATKSN